VADLIDDAKQHLAALTERLQAERKQDAKNNTWRGCAPERGMLWVCKSMIVIRLGNAIDVTKRQRV
jgi:hypothetical protein